MNTVKNHKPRRRPAALPPLGRHQIERNLDSYGDLISSRLGGLPRPGDRMRFGRMEKPSRGTLWARLIRWLKQRAR